MAQVDQLKQAFFEAAEGDEDYAQATRMLDGRVSMEQILVGDIEYISDEFDVEDSKSIEPVPLEEFSYYDMSWKQVVEVLEIIEKQLEELKILKNEFLIANTTNPEKLTLFLTLKGNIEAAERLVKRLTFEDYYRIWALSEYSIKHDNLIYLENMLKVLSWHRGKSSPEPFFESFNEASAPFQEHWNASPAFGFLKKWIEESETPEEKMEHMNRFEMKLEETLVHRTGWQSWSTVPRNNMQFDVSLFAGEFAGAEEILERWFLNAWNGFQDLSFNLHWADSHESSAVGSALLLPTKLLDLADPNKVSYVDPQKAEMHLKGSFRVATFAHEMGHVLGLPDEYYTVWDADKCEYQVWSQKGNLMSNSFGGRVLPHHIERLREIYNEPIFN